MGIRTAKTIMNELIKAKRDAIWIDYAAVKQHPQPDYHLNRWIQIVLKSIQGQATPIAPSTNVNQMTVPQE
jgi:hypothetical protein